LLPKTPKPLELIIKSESKTNEFKQGKARP